MGRGVTVGCAARRGGSGRADHDHGCVGDHADPRLWTVTVIGLPVSGSVEWMVTARRSIAAMPRASIAHIAYAYGPPSMSTTCGEGRAENGYAARIAPV